MKGAPWFKFFPADFIGGTVELSSEERGSYITLLCAQWMTQSLPSEHDRLERIAGGRVSDAVRGKFVAGQDGRLRNERLESHREEATAKSRGASNAAARSWQSRRNADAYANADANAMQTHMPTQSERNASAYAETRGQSLEARGESLEAKGQKSEQPLSPPNQPPETAKRRAPGNTGGGYSEDFESFWTAYPRKAGKGAAWKAWRSAKMKPVQETILSAVQAAKGSDQWTKDNGQFIPHPATWINQARWDDVPTIATGQPAAMPEKPRGTWDIEKQLEVLRSERDRLNRSDFERTSGREAYPEQFAKLQEINRQIQRLRGQIAGKA